MDTNADKFLDSQRRGGISRKGDLTRPLKERKIRWLYNHWWGSGDPKKPDDNFIWYDHTGGKKGVTHQPKYDHLYSLRPGEWLGDDIAVAYLELLAIREDKLWKSNQLRKPARRFFFAPTYFFVWAEFECTDLTVILQPYHLFFYANKANNWESTFVETFNL